MSRPLVVQGSIFDSAADAIVNPANNFLLNGAGLARMIEHRAGPEFAKACKAAPTIATGNAIHTTAGALPFKGVINVVGPVWDGGQFGERGLLARAMGSILRVAGEQGYESVACPAVSCGLFRFPVEQAAKILVDVVSAQEKPWLEWWQPVIDVSFYVLDKGHFEAFRKAGADGR